MKQVIGKGFQVLSIVDGESIEILYWLTPDGVSYTTDERAFDSANFDKKGQQWRVSEEFPAEAVFIGNYAKPEAINLPFAEQRFA